MPTTADPKDDATARGVISLSWAPVAHNQEAEQQLAVDKFLSDMLRTLNATNLHELPSEAVDCYCDAGDAVECAVAVATCVPICIKSLGTLCLSCVARYSPLFVDCCHCVGRVVGGCSWC